ncbi:MAG TPA: ferrous iron transport protein B [Kofleriaceae bacterium]
MNAAAEPKRLHVVLAGNPNVGKTTLFNALTGSSAKVSNYPGITVDRKRGKLQLPGGRTAEIDDVPGTYSVNARSAEEQIALDALVGLADAPVPDVVVVCVDATSVARSCYLLLQLQELGARCVVALTMVDEAAAATPDAKDLAALLGCDVVPVTARTGAGLPQLIAAIDRASHAERRTTWRWEPGASLREKLQTVRAALPAEWTTTELHGAADDRADNALALWALTCIEPRGKGDDDELIVPDALRTAAVSAGATADVDNEAVLGRWTWLDREIPALIKKRVNRDRTQSIDRVLLHRVAGFLVFLAVMTMVFACLFWGADPLISGIEWLFDKLGGLVRSLLGDGIFTDFLVDGVIAGVGSVVVFLPQIMMLFLFLGFLEDCGYLARIAYLMDRVMRAMNLHGRAFVPMLSGFACAIPAVMATRTMERKRDRILTMMVVPLMTCSARLPIYSLVIAALLPGSHLVQAMLLVGMYLFSVITSLFAAFVLSRTVKPLKAKRLPFLIELPPYRLPRIKDVIRSMRTKSFMFLREAGTVILGCSIVLWALLYFPRELPKGSPDFPTLIEKAPTPAAKETLQDQRAALRLENSFGGKLGHTIEPVIKPLGFDWKIGVGIIGAFAAREVFVSTLGIVFGLQDADETSTPLRDSLRHEKKADGSRAYTPLMGLSLMIFFALACQCMSTLAVVRRESGSWRWPAFLFTYMTVLAYVVSFVVYQGGKLLGFS